MCHGRYSIKWGIVAGLLLGGSVMACDLKVDSAWIREAPATAASLAGYAVLSNSGKTPLTIVSVSSPAFARVELHETLNENGMMKMRALNQLEIAPGTKVAFAPNGKHFMMMNPKPGLRAGDAVAVKLKDATGCESTAQFKVSSDAASATDAMDHSKMNHSSMDMTNMNSSSMQH